MTENSQALEDRLARFRWEQGQTEALRLLRDEIGLPMDQYVVVPFEKVVQAWETYLTRLRARDELILTWPETDSDDLSSWLAALTRRCGDRRALWFSLDDHSVPVAIEVSMGPILERGLELLDFTAKDLFLASRDSASGLCIELNAMGATDREFELVAWGGFAAEE